MTLLIEWDDTTQEWWITTPEGTVVERTPTLHEAELYVVEQGAES